MELLNAVIKALDTNGEIYFDTTVGWYEGDNDFRTGGQDIIYLKKKNKYLKKYDYAIFPNQILKEEKDITLEEICKELSSFSVTVEEILSGAIINRAQWECKG